MELGVHKVAPVKEVSKPRDGKKMKFFFPFIAFYLLVLDETLVSDAMLPSLSTSSSHKRPLDNIPMSSNGDKRVLILNSDKYYGL